MSEKAPERGLFLLVRIQIGSFRLGDDVEAASGAVGKEDFKLLRRLIAGFVLVPDEFGVVVTRVDEAVVVVDLAAVGEAFEAIMLPIDGRGDNFRGHPQVGGILIGGCGDVDRESVLAGVGLVVGGADRDGDEAYQDKG